MVAELIEIRIIYSYVLHKSPKNFNAQITPHKESNLYLIIANLYYIMKSMQISSYLNTSIFQYTRL